jgi:hypothetical protein
MTKDKKKGELRGRGDTITSFGWRGERANPELWERDAVMEGITDSRLLTATYEWVDVLCDELTGV